MPSTGLAKNEISLASHNRRNIAHREVGDIPAIKDEKRRERAKWDLLYDMQTYHPEKFLLDFSSEHYRLISLIQGTFLEPAAGFIMVAMPRGSGKTTIARAGIEWAIRHGHLKWPILITADSDLYMKHIRAFQVTFKTKEILADDFPETIWCLQRARTSQAAKNLTCRHEPMNIVWNTSEIVFPSNYMSRELGTDSGVISGGGITGSVRGAQLTLPTGDVIRPDAFLIDDFQTRESAHSPKQVKDRLSIMAGDIKGMGGPGKPIRGIATGTVIAKNDGVDQLLGAEYYDWQKVRVKWIVEWPVNMDRWHEYGDLLRRLKATQPKENELVAAGLGWETWRPKHPLSKLNDFYLEHRAELEEGAKVYWDVRIDPPYLTSLQTAMSWWMLDPEAFQAEAQNDPEDDHEPDDVVYCSKDEIKAKLSSLERYQIPQDAVELIAFVDVQLDMLIYAVMAVCPEFRRYVVDYGTFPDQGRRYWTKASMAGKLSDHWTSPQEGWVEGLGALSEFLKSIPWEYENGSPAKLTFGLVDAAFGDSTDSVFQFCRNSGLFFPSFGVGITASRNELNHGSEAPAWKKRHVDWGVHWNRRRDTDRMSDRYAYDSSFWKSSVHTGLRTPEEQPGSLQLYQDDHVLIADHLRAEYPLKTMGRGREVTEWKLRPGQDNDLFDCLAGCSMGASAKKICLPGTEGYHARPKKRKRRHIKKNESGRRW